MGSRSQTIKSKRFGTTSSGARRPKMATRPTVAGTNTVGQVLTGTNGTFTGSGTVTITRQWLRNGVPISGATAATYTLVAADSGKTVIFRNVGTSRHGAAFADSLPRSIA